MDGDRQLPATQGQLITPPSGTRTGSGLLSPGLKKLLTEGADSGGACRLISLNRTLRAECERVLPALEAAKEPATDEQVLEIVARRMVAYGITANLAFSHGVTWESYVSGFGDMPLYAVEDAFDRWDRGEGTNGNLQYAGLPPKPPQLAILAAKGKTELWMAAYRARKALGHIEKTGQDWTPERRAAERQKSIDAGHLNPDGSLRLPPLGRRMPEAPHPTNNPQEVAARLREADGKARHGGAPISQHHIDPPADDVGDVI